MHLQGVSNFQRSGLGGLALVALVTATPILMTAVMDRGHEIPKLMLGAPLALVALAAMIFTNHWRQVMCADGPSTLAASALLVFLGLGGLSTLFSPQPWTAFHGSFARVEGYVSWLAYGAAFFAALAWAHTYGKLQHLVDAMLLASVVPASYALQQSFGLDFYVVAGRDPSRAMGTQGNPIQLAEYLAALIPLTLARIWLVKARARQSLGWYAVLGFQAAGLWVTQSRGPLLAMLAGVALLGLLAAATSRKRGWLLGIGAAVIAGLAFLLVINVVAGVRPWAQSVPFVSRFVFDVGPDAGLSTSLASRSVTARLGVWQAGTEAFAASPIARQLFGYGPESAFFSYYPHIPPSVLRSEDFRTTVIFDKLHADSLDVGLNFGALAWAAYLLFFNALVFVAGRYFFSSALRVSVLFFLLLTGSAALVCGAAAAAFGFPQAALPAGCLGIAAGWLLFFGVSAWRSAGQAENATFAEKDRTKWILVAGLCASVLVFWIDAQVNIPLFTSRVIFFFCAALMLALASTPEAPAPASNAKGPDVSINLVDWGVTFALLAACASFLPVMAFDKAIAWVPNVGLRLLPVGALCLVAFTHLLLPQTGTTTSATWKRMPLVLVVPFGFGLLQILLRVDVEENFGPPEVHKLAALVALAPALIVASCILAVLWGRRFDAGQNGEMTFTRATTVAVCVALSCLAAKGAWQATLADISATSAGWSVVRDRESANQLAASAVENQPREWQYRRMALYRHLESGIAELSPAGIAPERFGEFVRRMRLAEAYGREAVRLEPANPWPLFSLANVLQVRALRLIREFDPVGGANAEREANDLFRRAQTLFPAQPMIYRNWAQLKFDAGFSAEGYELLAAMEAIIPEEPEPYADTILMARKFGHLDEERAVLERARKKLPSHAMEIVGQLAKKQQ